MLQRLILLLMLVAAWPTGARAQTPFTCTGDIYQVQSGQLRIFNPLFSTYTNIGPAQAGYNAMGYSSADNFIYAIQSSKIIRVDATGAVTPLFTLGFSSSSADMDDSNNLWIQRSQTLITRFNVLTGTSSNLTLTGGMIPSGAVDLAFVTTTVGDRIVALGSTGVSVTDPATGATVSSTVSSYPNEGTSGATWADASGRVFTFKNSTGNVYEIKNYMTATPSATLVAVGVPSGNNDGASCRTQPFPNLPPLAFDDSFTTSFQTAISGNILSNNGNGPDNDPDGTTITVNTTPVSAPANGSVILSSNGNFSYTPNTGFSGTDQFTYTISDAAGLTATAVVTITVTKAVLAVTKSSSVYTPTAEFAFFLPGNDVIYAIEITNTGNQAADSNSIVAIDLLPSTMIFYNGDINSGGPATYAGANPVAWLDTGSGLTFTYANDVRYSNLPTAPANFAACTYTPSAGYDANVRSICINPKGAMLGNGGKATFYLRMRIP
jgi:uncharacterized repeat protein (TIGR01451 family)